MEAHALEVITHHSITTPPLDNTNMTWTHQRSSPTSRPEWGSVKMTDWINTLFSLRAAVGQLRSQELTFNSHVSSCIEMLNAWRRHWVGRVPCVAKKLHLLLQVLTCVCVDRTTGRLRALGIKTVWTASDIWRKKKQCYILWRNSNWILLFSVKFTVPDPHINASNPLT